MRVDILCGLSATLARLTIGSPLFQPVNTTSLAADWNGEEPVPNSVAAHLEGLPGCWGECFIKKNKYFHTDMNFFTFHDFCGPYWKAVQQWEFDHVLSCAMHDCLETPCGQHNYGTCDLPRSVYKAHNKWLVEHCRGIRDLGEIDRDYSFTSFAASYEKDNKNSREK